MTLDQDAMTAEIYSEFYTLSQQATREALKAYDLSEIDRENLILETKQNKKSLVYKLFYAYGVDKTLIATTKVSTITKAATVKVTNLDKKE
ncbi:hypothetical protein [Teredinibacter purpureus]|uniref:hypothetical protein n=1 Tax=Teredinibacter purpureus TaxID=2731756 RepID=UPI0005F7C93A|nr:hypothetical protein [Teredinibacter purpureus]